MNYEIFKWIPLVDAEQEIESLVDVIQLGDGVEHVEQGQEKGLRKYINKFSDQKFVSSEAEIAELTVSFIEVVDDQQFS